MAVITVMVAGAPVAAQDTGSRAQVPVVADSQGAGRRLNEVVVTATRTEGRVREMPALVTVVDRPAIQRAASRTMPDLLRGIPGITTRDYLTSVSAHPTRMAPSLRGLGGGTSAGRTLVLMDGMPIADPFAGWVHWARVPLDLVRRVEIVRGGGSGIWGSRAMGGVINIITEEPAVSGGQLSTEGGNLSTVRTTGNATWRRDRLGATVAGTFLDTDGSIGVKRDLRGPIDKPAGSRDAMGYGKVDYALSPSLSLTASGSYLDESRDWGSDLRDAGLTLGFLRASARWLAPDTSRWTLDVFASDQTFHSTFTTETLDRTTEEPSLDQFDVPATAAGASLQWSKRVAGRHEVTMGADLFRVDGEVNEDYFLVQNAFTRQRRVGGEQLLTGVFAQDVIRPATNWTVLASVRADYSRSSGGFRREFVKATNASLVDTTFASSTEQTVNFSVGLRREVSSRLAARANVYRAYRAPTLNELYKPFREPGNVIAEANADLVSEHVVGAEAGVDYVLGSGVLARLTGFWAQVRDPIVEATIGEAGATPRSIAPCGFVPAGGVCRQRQNLDRFRTAGIEAEVELQPSPAWHVSTAYVWNPTRVLEATSHPELEGNQGSRTPEHSATVSVDYRRSDALIAAVSARYVGVRFEDDLNRLDLESFLLLDATVQVALGPRWSLFASAENLADVEYETARPSSGLVRVGAPRTVLVGTRVRW